jgi:hypothetical protein
MICVRGQQRLEPHRRYLDRGQQGRRIDGRWDMLAQLLDGRLARSQAPVALECLGTPSDPFTAVA